MVKEQIEIDLITAGKRTNGYFQKLKKLDLNQLYIENNGFEFIEGLRDEWKAEYDFILVDSRTGVTDIGEISTIQLPDMLVFFFTAMEQSVNGVVDIYRKVMKAYQKFPNERLKLLSIPVPGRFDSKEEFEVAQQWFDIFATKLADIYLDWLPRSVTIKSILELTKIPYIAYFSFGEKLPVIDQGTNDPAGLGYAYENLAALIANNLENVALLFNDRSKFIPKYKPVKITQYKPIKNRTLTHDPHWRYKLDRMAQFSQVKFMTEEMLMKQSPKVLCFLWYGEQGQGIDHFHHRLRVEFRDQLFKTELIEIAPSWPTNFENLPESCEKMFNDAFETHSLYQIPSRIRELGSGNQSLVYIRHMPLTSTKVVTLDILKRYIEWLDHYFLPCLEKDRFFALVGISYVVNNPSKFYRLVEKRKISTMHHKNTVFRILEEMKKLDKQDLYDFLQTHNIKLPYDSKERVLDEIISKTDGHYEQTLYELENMVNRAWAMDEGVDEIDEEDEDLGVDD
ncbi:MAG: hypothetical protein OMM_05086 [Candidatus Magnetoglobus multicellularis str. Araruama]|uniref:Uncharacterized protein n=1 Tax=Candidatus Magnetoglobus multicellularis str. Araruama TaxID=890399 RepID=A0A1V1NY93_9BACT|nr:MAG: hypothetical protein OMM_05086 [Candidatus Magnetoglobus multicellularis str. Araruama]